MGDYGTKKKKKEERGVAKVLGGKRGAEYAIFLQKDTSKCLQPAEMRKGATFELRQCVLRGAQLYSTDTDGLVHSKRKSLCVRGQIGKPVRLGTCPNPKSLNFKTIAKEFRFKHITRKKT